MASPLVDRSSITLLYPGKIDRVALSISLGVLLGLCWLTAAVRFYVRVGIQKVVLIDDGFLLFGLACLTASVSLTFTFLDKAYILESFLIGQAALVVQPGFIELSFDCQKLVAAVCILSWIAICSVKLSFLFLFRRLIDRLHYLLIYWWIVLIFVLAASGYGIAIFLLACPYFYSIKAVQCTTSSGVRRVFDYSISQMALDSTGDILILIIPIHLIWKIKIGRKQKFWLASSLCLTIIMIVLTTIRVPGIITPSGQIDSIWGNYWITVSAEVGLILASATAFRTLYTSKASEHKRTPTSNQSWISTFIQSGKHLLVRAVHPDSWVNRDSDNPATPSELTAHSGVSNNNPKDVDRIELRTLPTAHMTGSRTILRNVGQSRTSISTVDIMQSHCKEGME